MKKLSFLAIMGLFLASCSGTPGGATLDADPTNNGNGTGNGSGNGGTQESLTASINTPVAVSASNQAAYPVTGTCNVEGGSFSITVEGVSENVTCSSGVFNATFDLSGVADSASISISVTINEETTNPVSPVAKDTVPPAVAIDGGVIAEITPFTDTATFTVNGTCDQSTTVNIQVDGADATGQTGFVCDGTNYTGTIDIRNIQYGPSVNITAVISDGVNSTVSTAHVLTKNPRISHPDPAVGNSYGNSVSISGNFMAIGAPGETVSSVNQSGAVYTYTKSGDVWTFSQKLVMFDESNVESARVGGGAGVLALARFGTSVAIDGNNIIIGAPGTRSLADVYGLFGSACSAGCDALGAVWIYVHDGSNWGDVRIIQDLPMAYGGVLSSGAKFGEHVAIDGSVIAISSPGDNSNTGRVFTYRYSVGNSEWATNPASGYDGYSEEVLLPSISATGNEFGSSLALEGSILAIGSDRASTAASEAGAVVIYEDSGTFSEREVLTASDASANMNFGHSVALSGGELIVGAPRKEISSQTNVGAVYLFEDNGTAFVNEVMREPTTTTAGLFYGQSVAISGSTVAVGVWGETVNSNSGVGSAYTYVLDNRAFTNEAKYNSITSAGSERMGSSFAIDGSHLYVGATGGDNGSAVTTGIVQKHIVE